MGFPRVPAPFFTGLLLPLAAAADMVQSLSLSLTLLLERRDGVLSSSEVEAGVLDYIYIVKERKG